jgi:ESCRT-II complex subunit VPS36
MEFEVELKSENNVSTTVQLNKKVTEELFAAGCIILTNFRVMVVLSSTGVANKISYIGWGIHLKNVAVVEDCAKYLRFSTRFRLLFHSSTSEIGFRFEKDGKDEFLATMQKALDKKSWEDRPPPLSGSMSVVSGEGQEKVDETVFSSSNAGVAGIIRRQERSMQSVDSLTKSALTDLDALMNRAKEAIAVVQRYAVIASNSEGEKYDDASSSSSSSFRDNMSETSSQRQEKNEMETIMQNIGMVSPVTKFSAGRQYHQQLARQIADLLLQQNRLQRLGGMITLTDLYCLFNRARGTELVSPDDLHTAARMMRHLSLGLHLLVFPSGVKVLMSDSYNEEEVASKLAGFLRDDTHLLESGLQASDVAIRMNVSMVVAKEMLLTAERIGVLCRDEGIHGLFFFPNFIVTKWVEICS